MRLFVAVPVPAEVRQALAGALEDAPVARRGLRWTRPETWHLTLAFLGEVADGRLDEIAAAVDGAVEDAVAGAGGWELRLAAPGRFGRRVLWVGIDEEPPGTLARLGERVQQALAGADLPVEQRPVRPHLTLARAAKAEVTPAVVEAIDPPAVGWRADRVEVWRSHLGGGPARYETVHTAPLDPS